jgi:hypothetical protein
MCGVIWCTNPKVFLWRTKENFGLNIGYSSRDSNRVLPDSEVTSVKALSRCCITLRFSFFYCSFASYNTRIRCS